MDGPQNVDGRLWQPGSDARSVMVIEESVPEHDRHAGGLFMWQILNLLLEEGLQTALFVHDGQIRQPYADRLTRTGLELMTNRSDLVTWLRTTGGRTAAVILARPHIAQEYAELVRTNSPARLLYYTHDLHHVRLLRRFTTTWDWRALRQGRQIRGLEARIFRTVDGVVTPSIAEVPVIKRLAPSAEVTVVPPHLIGQGPPHPSALALRDREAVVMVGGFKHLPNVDAARYLVRDVMPIVWKSIPWARVMLVGGDAPAEITALAEDRVEILGYVADLGDVYARARMSVSPIRYGAGFKGKILSSLEAGIPVVTTPIGNEGIGLEPNYDAMIADDAVDLAAAVVHLYRDPDLLERLAAAGKTAASERFSRESARQALLAALHL